jgi:hypothetical protein
MHPLPERTPDATTGTLSPAGGDGRITNPPGQASIAYRSGTYDTFFQAMIARLPLQEVPDPRQPGVALRPLMQLTTRDRSDLAIALVDAWAVVCDVISFYQERNANEAYLGTARERLSVVELARAIGYEFNPGVAASAALVFTIEETPHVVTIPAGTQVQSSPEQGQPPQVFETVETIEARAEWNVLRPQLTAQQIIGLGTTALDLAGTNTQLQPGQPILFPATSLSQPATDAARTPPEFRLIQTVEPSPARERTRITWQPPLRYPHGALPAIHTFRERSHLFGYDAPDWSTLPDAIKAEFGNNLPAAVTSIAVTPDGKNVVSAQQDGSIFVWQVGTPFIRVLQFPTQTAAVLAVAIAPDGTQVLSGGADHFVRLWDMSGNILDTFGGHTDAVTGVAFSPNYASDKQFISGSLDGTVKLWNAQQPEPVRTYEGNQGAVNGVAFAPDATALLAACANRVVILWAISGAMSGTYSGHNGAVTCVAFSPDYATDKRFLSGCVDTMVRLWNSDQQSQPIRVYQGHTAEVTSLAFAPDNASVFISGSDDHTVIVWQEQTATPHYIMRQHLMGVTSVAFLPLVNVPEGPNTPDVHWAISASDDTTLVSWSWDTTAWRAMQIVFQPQDRNQWPHFVMRSTQIDLATTDSTITPGDMVALWTGDGTTFAVFSTVRAETASRSDFFLTAEITRITPDPDVNPKDFGLRDTIVATHAEALPLATSLITTPLPPCPDEPSLRNLALTEQSNAIQLDRAPAGLRKGQQISLTGLLYDCEARRPTTQTAAEILLLEEIALDAADAPTVLIFQSDLQHTYVRSSVILNANAAVATQGETVADEVLGSGDGTVPNQAFTLQRKPLTYVPQASARGNRSTLNVRVNDVSWQEVEGFVGLGPHSQSYIVRENASGQASVLFGDGQQGSRLPPGEENIRATYRVGMGMAGEVGANTLTQPTNQPPAVTAVTNPAPASGAAPMDTRASARVKAPLTVTTLGRIVSLQDYDNFARTFAGIGRVRTSLLWGNHTRVIHLTILGADGKPIADSSPIYTSLTRAIAELRAPGPQVVIQSGSVLRPFAIAATVMVQPRYRAGPVRDAIATRLKAKFSTEARAFGQGVAASEVMNVIQAVPGVRAVDLRSLYFAGDPRMPHDYLAATLARWNPEQGQFEPDQILVIDTDSGIDLTMREAPE